MNMEEILSIILEEQSEIALATSVDNYPNVRVVNFYYNRDLKKLFFSTFKDNDKVFEFDKNSNVSFTSIPKNGVSHVKGYGVVERSSKKIEDMKSEFIKKIPEYQEIIDDFGESLLLFEVSLKKAKVVLSMECCEEIIF